MGRKAGVVVIDRQEATAQELPAGAPLFTVRLDVPGAAFVVSYHPSRKRRSSPRPIVIECDGARSAATPHPENAAARILLAHQLALPRGGGRRAVAELLAPAFGSDDAAASDAARALAAAGLRPVRACEGRGGDDCACRRCVDPRLGRRVPRVGPGDQVWLATPHVGLGAVFAGTSFAQTWKATLLELPGAAAPRRTVRIDGAPRPAISLPLKSLEAVHA